MPDCCRPELFYGRMLSAAMPQLGGSLKTCIPAPCTWARRMGHDVLGRAGVLLNHRSRAGSGPCRLPARSGMVRAAALDGLQTVCFFCLAYNGGVRSSGPTVLNPLRE